MDKKIDNIFLNSNQVKVSKQKFDLKGDHSVKLFE